MKIQTKTTFLFTILTISVFLVLMATVFYFSNQFAYNDFYKRLELRARLAARLAFEKDNTTSESFKEIQQQYLEPLADEKSFVIKLTANNTPELPVAIRLPGQYFNDIKKANGGTVYYRDNFLHYAGILYKDESGNFVVIASAINSYGTEVITRLGKILAITLVASIVLIYSVGLYFSRKTFQPFRYITNRVQAISEGNLQLRLKEQEGSDEIAALIKTFNQMLDRMETAFETQNNFVSNASHELRTPLTAIVAEADYSLSKERTPEAYRQSLENIMQQAEKLQNLTKGLLSLAQTSFDGTKQRWEKIRIDELLFEVKQNVGAIVPESNIQIKLNELPANEEELAMYGNYDLLKIAVGNILLNASKYSSNAPVEVDLSFKPKQAIITIADKGIGIPEKEMQNIYDPFFRASNTKGFEGYGIGMPLSGNIIRLHKGTIATKSKVNEGTTVAITLPLN